MWGGQGTEEVMSSRLNRAHHQCSIEKLTGWLAGDGGGKEHRNAALPVALSHVTASKCQC